MRAFAIYAAFYTFEAFCAVLDFVTGTKRQHISEHDHFADRAIYSDDPAVDPLA